MAAAAAAEEAWAGRRGRDRSCLRRIRCYGESREELAAAAAAAAERGLWDEGVRGEEIGFLE